MAEHDENDGPEGIMVEYKSYRTIGNETQIVTDTIAYQGSYADFKRDPVFKMSAVVRYTQILDGQMDESSVVMVNETLRPLPPGRTLDPNMVGAIKPEAIAGAPQLIQPPPHGQVPLNISVQPKILKDGDSYIKVEGAKVSRLVWGKYVDEDQPIDNRVRVDAETGEISITKWVVLGEA